APRASKQPARRVERLFKRMAECDMAREYSRLALRLTVATHGAIGDDATILEHGERRIKRVKGATTGGKRINRLWVERETCSAVLHHDAGRRQNTARAEFPIQRLNIRNDEPARICRAHPDGIAFTMRCRPARGLACIDFCGFRVE